MPTQHDLSGALAVNLGNLGQRRIAQEAHAVIAPARVEGDPANGRPRLRDDSVVSIGRLHGLLLEIRVKLNLVDSRDHVAFTQQFLQVKRHEVADTNGAHLALIQQLFERLVRLDGFLEPSRSGLVQDQQIEVVDAQLGDRLLPSMQGLLDAIVTDPDLGFNENISAVKSGFLDAEAHLALISVGGGSVDVTVARVQSR